MVVPTHTRMHLLLSPARAAGHVDLLTHTRAPTTTQRAPALTCASCWTSRGNVALNIMVCLSPMPGMSSPSTIPRICIMSCMRSAISRTRILEVGRKGGGMCVVFACVWGGACGVRQRVGMCVACVHPCAQHKTKPTQASPAPSNHLPPPFTPAPCCAPLT